MSPILHLPFTIFRPVRHSVQLSVFRPKNAIPCYAITTITTPRPPIPHPPQRPRHSRDPPPRCPHPSILLFLLLVSLPNHIFLFLLLLTTTTSKILPPLNIHRILGPRPHALPQRPNHPHVGALQQGGCAMEGVGGEDAGERGGVQGSADSVVEARVGMWGLLGELKGERVCSSIISTLSIARADNHF